MEQAGYTVDDFTDITWSDYMEKAKVVLEKTGLPMLTAQAGSPDVIMEMLQSAGASLFNEDGTANIKDNDVLRKCVEIYAQMVADGTLVRSNRLGSVHFFSEQLYRSKYFQWLLDHGFYSGSRRSVRQMGSHKYAETG